ncbi:hypothetical protein KR093_009656 [Drosophila rubida]|uniref:Uncharacterized protein n=1 Tax=Drosophila rubida TaxID=30044 RepID=A0AAD4PQT0_9MUSC|nr:hypothetical protein KR093_009656 [Drosophila rubida]
MITKPRAAWPLLLQLLLLSLVVADVAHLAKEYLPPDVGQASSQPLADEPTPVEQMPANDGAYYPTAGLMLPPGYAIPTSDNIAAPPMSPPNFPLPIYPPFFGFVGGPEGLGGAQVPPGFPNQPQFAGGAFPVAAQGGQFPVGPQGGAFAAGPQSGPFPVAPQVVPQFSVGPQAGPSFAAALQNGNFPVGPQGGPFPAGPQAGPFPTEPQGALFPVGPEGGPFPAVPQAGPFPAILQPGAFPNGPQSAAFPVGPTLQNPFAPDYLTTQGLPAAGMQLPFGMPPSFAGPAPTYPYQPFSPSFGVPGQHYQPQPQPFADEPAPETNAKLKISVATSTTVAPKSRNRETIYASNGGYVYQRAK